MTRTEIAQAAHEIADHCETHRREYDSGEARDLSILVERLASLVADLADYS